MLYEEILTVTHIVLYFIMCCTLSIHFQKIDKTMNDEFQEISTFSNVHFKYKHYSFRPHNYDMITVYDKSKLSIGSNSLPKWFILCCYFFYTSFQFFIFFGTIFFCTIKASSIFIKMLWARFVWMILNDTRIFFVKDLTQNKMKLHPNILCYSILCKFIAIERLGTQCNKFDRRKKNSSDKFYCFIWFFFS